jgi:cytoskeletal protein CcmA (bactofilin family)
MPEEPPVLNLATTSIIGDDLMISGNVTSAGELHIDGRIEGDVRCASLILGDSSEIKGNVIAEEVMVRGRLIGSVRGRRVILHSSAHVEGDVFHKDLAMEQGAYFDGESRRSDDPMAAAKAQGEQMAVKPRQDHAQGQKEASTFVRNLPESD